MNLNPPVDELTIKAVQAKLSVEGYYTGSIDGDPGPKTVSAAIRCLRDFFGSTHITSHGAVIVTPRTQSQVTEFPVKPDFALMHDAERQRVFGTFGWTPRPGAVKGQPVTILGDWEDKNVVSVEIPELSGKPWYDTAGSKFGGRAWIHRKAAAQIQRFFGDVKSAGLLDRILTLDGFGFARYKTSSTTSLSNHAYFTAFDLNAQWNGFGQKPAEIGKRGCLWELVPIAHKNGLYWGGHFSTPDGMHFEVAKIL